MFDRPKQELLTVCCVRIRQWVAYTDIWAREKWTWVCQRNVVHGHNGMEEISCLCMPENSHNARSWICLLTVICACMGMPDDRHMCMHGYARGQSYGYGYTRKQCTVMIVLSAVVVIVTLLSSETCKRPANKRHIIQFTIQQLHSLYSVYRTLMFCTVIHVH